MIASGERQFKNQSRIFTLCFGLPGLWCDLVGIALNNADATADIRATYGGLEVGTAVFLILITIKNDNSDNVKIGLLASALLLAGMFAARLLGIFLEVRSVGNITYILPIAELLGVASIDCKLTTL